MKSTIACVFATVTLAAACNNAGTESTEITDSSNQSTTVDSMNNPVPIAVDEASSSFLVGAAMGSMTEVQEGELAQQKATNQSVKDFATMMINDHTDAGNKIKNLAAPRNINLPTSVIGDEQKMMDNLANKKGTAFDKAYIDGMVEDHQKDVKEFEEAEKKVTDPEVKAFITATIPTLKMHLDSAKAIQKRLK